MGEHLISGEFQSDKYPACPRGKVPLSTKDPMAQDLLWEYAQRRRKIDPEFSSDLKSALELSGFITNLKKENNTMDTLTVVIHYLKKDKKFLKDYQEITIKDEQDITIAEYGNETLDQGNEKANGFIAGVLYIFPDMTIEYKNVADYANEGAWHRGIARRA